MYPYGRSQYCLVFFTWKTPPHSYTHIDSNTPIVSFFPFFSLFGLSFFIVFCFMATFITRFFYSFHLLVGMNASRCSHRLAKFWLRFSLSSVPVQRFSMWNFPASWKWNFVAIFFENWFSPSDFGGWPFRNHSRISLTIVPNTVPADRSRWTISFKRDMHFSSLAILPPVNGK